MLRPCCTFFFWCLWQPFRFVFSCIGAMFVCCGCIRFCGYRIRSNICVKRFLRYSCYDSRSDTLISCILFGITSGFDQLVKKKKLHVTLKTGEDSKYTYRTPNFTAHEINYPIANLILEQGYEKVDVFLNEGKHVIAKGSVDVGAVIAQGKCRNDLPMEILMMGTGLNPPPKLSITWMDEENETKPLKLGFGLAGTTDISNLDIEEVARLCSGPLYKVSSFFGVIVEYHVHVHQMGNTWVLAWHDPRKKPKKGSEAPENTPDDKKYIDLSKVHEIYGEFSAKDQIIISHFVDRARTADLQFERKSGPTVKAWVEGLQMIVASCKEKKNRKKARSVIGPASSPSASPTYLHNIAVSLQRVCGMKGGFVCTVLQSPRSRW